MVRFLLALLVGLAACHREPQPTHPDPNNLPPLPPASGTPVGYLLDAQGSLKLSADQLTHLQQIDASLAARDAEIDTQLRQVEKPPEDDPDEKNVPPDKRKPHNNAPGAQGKPTGDAARLHDIRDAQDRDALKQVWALLDKDQKTTAAKILSDHDVEVPGAPRKREQTSDDGVPLPGMEP
ncbi:MAG TPA: hypothetical protein VLX92_14140 [Kofleriaceae bacterium]|nr:hypothetical protein [Kofleriaceae bacterium]